MSEPKLAAYVTGTKISCLPVQFSGKHCMPKELSNKYMYREYGKCSKISYTFLFLFSNKMLIFRAGIHNMDVRIANREDPDQTASLEAV